MQTQAMAEADVEAKKLHTKRLEEILTGPVFDIFHVQRAQLAEKTESQNSLLFHFKSSMAKVRTWNSATIRGFVAGLVERFPVLGCDFEKTFQDLQQVTCRLLNASSTINEYEVISEPSHTYLHELISACADSFISHPEWFQVSTSSPEQQTVLNNMKIRMNQSAVVANTVMAFMKTCSREPRSREASESQHSDLDIYDNNDSSDASDVSTVKGSKSINMKSGAVTQAVEDTQPSEADAAAATDDTTDHGQTNDGTVLDQANDCTVFDQVGTGGDKVHKDKGGDKQPQGDSTSNGGDCYSEEPSKHSSDYRSEESSEHTSSASDLCSEHSSAVFFIDDSYSSGLSLGSDDSRGSTEAEQPHDSDVCSMSGTDACGSTESEQPEQPHDSDVCSMSGTDSVMSFYSTDESDHTTSESTCSSEITLATDTTTDDSGYGDASDSDEESEADTGGSMMSSVSDSADVSITSEYTSSSTDDSDTTGESVDTLVWESVSDGSHYTAEESASD
ncbi:unnamed protein product [Ectocarpus sp. 6 AP-2014]